MGMINSLLLGYNIQVRVWSRDQSGVDIAPNAEGKFVDAEIPTEDGPVYKQYLAIKIPGRFKVVKTHMPDSSYYQNVGKKRRIDVFQVDRETYYPIAWMNGKLIVKEPVYKMRQVPQMDAEGKQMKDEAGQLLFTQEPEVEEKTGLPIVESWKDVPFLDTTVALKNGKLINLPTAVISKTYETKEWLANGLVSRARLYRRKTFWDKWGNLISGIVVVTLLIMALAVFMKYFSPQLEGIASAMNNVADKLVQHADIWRQTVQGTPATTVVKPPM